MSSLETRFFAYFWKNRIESYQSNSLQLKLLVPVLASTACNVHLLLSTYLLLASRSRFALESRQEQQMPFARIARSAQNSEGSVRRRATRHRHSK